MMKRREFLMSSAAVAAAGRAWGQRPDQAKLDRISAMSGGFGPLLKGTARQGDPQATIDLMDLAAMVAERYGIHRVEFQHTDFPSTEPAYLEEFRSRMKKANCQMNQINLEFANLNISSPERMILLETIDLTKTWIDHAAALGCPRVMVNQGTLAPEVRQTAIETLKTINAYGKAKKVFVTMENRELPPREGAPKRENPVAHWDVVVDVIKASGIWANPDSGNFPDNESRKAGLPVLYQMTAGSSHVKHMPDRYDTGEAIRIAKEVGYKGIFSIEASSRNSPDPYAPVQTIVDIIVANL
jgi:sugar phosphate isomerase/epimerase